MLLVENPFSFPTALLITHSLGLQYNHAIAILLNLILKIIIVTDDLQILPATGEKRQGTLPPLRVRLPVGRRAEVS